MSTNTIEGLRNASQYGRISYEFEFILFIVVEIAAGSLLNSLVILVLPIFNRRPLEILANVILLSLAVSDLFACSIVLPYHLHEILKLRETLALFISPCGHVLCGRTLRKQRTTLFSLSCKFPCRFCNLHPVRNYIPSCLSSN